MSLDAPLFPSPNLGETAVPWLTPRPIEPADGAASAIEVTLLADDAPTASTVLGDGGEVASMRLGFDAPDEAAVTLTATVPTPASATAPAPPSGGGDRAPAATAPSGAFDPAAAAAADVPGALAAAAPGFSPMSTVDLDAAAFDGAGTAIIVIDDGYSPYYDQSNTVFGYDFSGVGDGSAMESTWRSHGSWVADVATDVAPGTDIIHLKVFADGSGSASLADVEEALQWSVRHGEAFGAVAVNMSLGFGNATAAVQTSLSDELAALADRNIATTVAAGNDGERYADGVNVLAADPEAIAVSAVDGDDRLTAWSQRSDALTDVAALGEGVRVDSLYGWEVEVAGTSFAAPYVAGTAARLQDAADALMGERLSPEEIVAVIDASGRPVAGGDADAYRVADADAAVDYFVEHHTDFADAAFVA